MTTNTIGQLPNRQRPFGVTLLAALIGFSAALGAFVLVAAGGLQGAALIAWLIVAVNAVCAYGLWNLRSWAWPLTLVVSALGTLDAILLLTAGTLNTNLIVGPLSILYLLRSDVSALFRRDA